MPPDFRVSLTNPPGEGAYPIASFTWLLVYKEQSYDKRPRDKVEAMMKLLWWVIHDGQKYAESLSYAKLPTAVVAKAETILKSVTYGGVPILK